MYHTKIQKLVGKQNYKIICMDTHTGTWLKNENGEVLSPKNIIGTDLVTPRCLQKLGKQRVSTKKQGEVYTCSEIVNYQNSIFINKFFGRHDVFFSINKDLSYQPVEEKITFPDGKIWTDFVEFEYMEPCCGESPFLIGLHDVHTFKYIPFEMVAGMLSCKLRVISENTRTKKEWCKAAQIALESVRGYDIKAQSVLLSREAAIELVDFAYKIKFGPHAKIPAKKMNEFIEIITYNFWVMDGVNFCHPITNEKCTFINWRTLDIIQVSQSIKVGNLKDDVDNIERGQPHNTVGNSFLPATWLTQSTLAFGNYTVDYTGLPYTYTAIIPDYG